MVLPASTVAMTVVLNVVALWSESRISNRVEAITSDALPGEQSSPRQSHGSSIWPRAPRPAPSRAPPPARRCPLRASRLHPLFTNRSRWSACSPAA